MDAVASKEQWRGVAGYEGLYEVSDRGVVRSLTRTTTDSLGRTRRFDGRVLSAGLGVGGLYLSVALVKNGKQRTHYVHDLVAAAFIGPKPRGQDVRHGIGGSRDNCPANLCYGTRLENHRDKYRDGTMYTRAVRRSDGRVFGSLKEAAHATGLTRGGSGIVNAINRTRGTRRAGGYEWAYV